MPSISQTVERYVLEHPSIKDNLAKDLINYSKLARAVINETDLKKQDFDAVLIALRRQHQSLKKKQSYQRKIREVLKETTLDIKTGIYVGIIEKTRFHDYLLNLQKHIKDERGTVHLVEGSDTVTIITEQRFKQAVRKKLENRIIKESEEHVAIIMKSPETLEDVPGVVGFIYSLFSTRGINILETMSCWRDTILVIEKQHLQAATELLKF